MTSVDRLALVSRVGRTITHYRYDYRGLRRQKVTADGTTDFTYDTSGHLISQRTVRGRDVGQRDYLWTDTAPIARIDSPIGQAKVHKNWLPQALMGFLHRHEGREHDRAARLYYFHTDAMGTPRLATDAKQQVVWRWNEDAFGAKVSTDQERHGHRDHDWDHGRRHDIEVNLRYPGQYYDSETGLFYNWNRYYDPHLGRYRTSDPIGLSGGVNTYGYVGGNPPRYSDLLGFAYVKGIPSGAVQYTAPNGESFYAPPSANFQAIYQAGQANGPNPFGIEQAVGHFGTYDFQRQNGNFYPAYTNASNYAVEVYMAGAGFGNFETDFIGRTFQLIYSSNRWSSLPQHWWDLGWLAGSSGYFNDQCSSH